MRRIVITFLALAGIATLATGGLSIALSRPAGPLSGTLLAVSATTGLVAVCLAARILYVLEHAKAAHVPARDDR